MGEDSTYTGGCYCGAIRYESTEPPTLSAMCHCRMCQRWTGAAAAMALFFKQETFLFTKGQPKTFMTSEILERSFCGDCGTPIGHRYVVPPLGPNRPSVYIGTLDHPENVASPEFYMGVESHIPDWVILAENVPALRADTEPRLLRAWEAVGVSKADQD
jgi:hypothetical protein